MLLCLRNTASPWQSKTDHGSEAHEARYERGSPHYSKSASYHRGSLNATHQFVLPSRTRRRLGRKAAAAIGVSLLASALSFFVALFLSILTLFILGLARNARPDMSMAYRVIALPVAIAVLPIAIAGSLWWQLARERRNRVEWQGDERTQRR